MAKADFDLEGIYRAVPCLKCRTSFERGSIATACDKAVYRRRNATKCTINSKNGIKWSKSAAISVRGGARYSTRSKPFGVSML